MSNHIRKGLKLVQDDSELVMGCQYRTPWQNNGANNLILIDMKVRGKFFKKVKSVKLMSRSSKKSFWTTSNNLLFVNSMSNINKSKAIRLLNQAQHKPVLDGYYQDINDGSIWQVIDDSDEGRPIIKSMINGHEKGKSLGNFLKEFIFTDILLSEGKLHYAKT
jgi:hypothetical protein